MEAIGLAVLAGMWLAGMFFIRDMEMKFRTQLLKEMGEGANQ